MTRRDIKPKSMLAVFAGGAIALLAAATAWACTSLATITFQPDAVRPGQEVTVRGDNFQAGKDASPVDIRFASLVGPVLKTVEVDSAGRFTTTMRVPADVAFGGQYVIVATQEGEGGKPAFGTPARAPITIDAPAGQPTPPAAGAQPGQGPELAAEAQEETGIWTWIALAAIGALALILLGSGLALFARETRARRAAPARRQS